MKVSFTCFKNLEQDFYQSSSRPIWTWLIDRKIYSLKKIKPEERVTQTAILNNIPGHIFLWKEHISIEHEIIFHMLQESGTRLLPIIQQTNFNLTHRSKSFFRSKFFFQEKKFFDRKIFFAFCYKSGQRKIRVNSKINDFAANILHNEYFACCNILLSCAAPQIGWGLFNAVGS